MKIRTWQKLLIMAAVFIVAAIVAFLLMRNPRVGPEEVYSSSLEDAKLPVVWTYMFDEQINCMHGHISEPGKDAAYDTLTLMSSDRYLKFRADDHGSKITGARYEIRNEDLSELIEQTSVTDINISGEGADIAVKIQNLLTVDREYRFDLILSTQKSGDIHYYTRIKLTDETELAGQMLEFAETFSDKNFDYELAKDNTTYVETDGTADGSTLEYTNLKSTFDNLAYRGLKLSKVGETDKRLCIYDGNTGEVHLSFMATRKLSEGNYELYQIDETYSMRMGMLRIYLMNYSRDIHEVFVGDVSRISGKRILLGINDEKNIDVLKSDDGRYVYFLSSRDLWLYDSKTQDVRNIFSFRDTKDPSVICNYPRHNIRMITCDEEGNLVFLLYGYMNRGQHEGDTGISYMSYDTQSNLVTEVFFIPIAQNFMEIEMDVNELSFLGSNDMFYFKVAGSFYGIDTKSDNYIVIATELKDGSYCVSKDMDKLAWQSDSTSFGSERINVMDLNTGVKQEIEAENDVTIRPEGFIGRDLAISMHRKEDGWILNGKTRSLPAYVVEIFDDNLDILMHYEKKGLYLDDIEVRDARVNFSLFTKSGNDYSYEGDDTIVSSVETPDRPEGWGFYNNDLKGKVYYVELDEEVRRASIRVAANSEITDNCLVLTGIEAGEDSYFTAYGDGKLLLKSDSIVKAIDAAYGHMGHVRHNGELVYNRPSTVTSRLIADYEQYCDELMKKDKAGELMSLMGIKLRQVLYFVSQGYPVLAYTDNGEPAVIYYYDKEQVSLYYPLTHERRYPSVDEAAEMFERGYLDFSCDFTFRK